ncbi:MAG: glycosyltransferase family 4 protein [Gammaproteobacteria bacterium]|nr:glycosyltransferase family 4 protein [Gammaproteobacteria bacterium]MYC25828.1 glycosyltransferase family 4 protein [Gammaproteobacteria bacterium]
MKVVQVIPRLHGGGVERGTIEIAGYLKQLGHEAIVISEGGPLVKELTALGVVHVTKSVGSKSLRAVFGLWELRNYFKTTRPDIVHSRSRLPGWLCFLAIKLLPQEIRPHFVTSVHGLHSVSRYSAIIAKGERIEAVSTTAKRYLLDNYKTVDHERIRLIHRGVDPTKFNSRVEPSSEWLQDWNRWCQEHQSNGAPIVSLVGRISRLKGHHEFLEIIELLHEKSIPAVGLIVGGVSKEHNKLHQELQRKVQESETLRSSVHFLGHRSDVRELMSVSDIVVSLSATPEAFGRTVLEALSLGVAVVGYDYGGVGELLRTLFPAGAVPVGNVQVAADRIKDLLSRKHPIESHEMTLQSMRDKTIAMYEELLC